MNENVGNVDERISYINCESGDVIGTIHVKLESGKTKEFVWDSINVYENQAIAMAMLFASDKSHMSF